MAHFSVLGTSLDLRILKVFSNMFKTLKKTCTQIQKNRIKFCVIQGYAVEEVLWIQLSYIPMDQVGIYKINNEPRYVCGHNFIFLLCTKIH